jgi:hypothetical protein
MRSSRSIQAGAAVLLALCAALLVVLLRPRDVRAKPAAQLDSALPTGAPVSAGAEAGLDAGVQPISDKATIVFITVPNVTATVTWGRKLLGKITPGNPLVVVRPRDSGPLDVMVRAPGYLGVQTRAHTFSDSRILVKLTPPEKKNELLGYRIPIEAGLEGGVPGEGGIGFGDGGAVWSPAPAPVVPAPPMLPMPLDAGVAY